MLTRTLSALAVAGLLIVVTGASVPNATASNETVAQPSCCIKRAYCCKLQRECCPNRASDASVATVDADDAVASASRPSCCVKRAYCCSIQRECCHRGAASSDNSVATEADVMDVPATAVVTTAGGGAAVAMQSCCVKRAYCCKVVRDCCRSANTAGAAV